MAAGVTVRASNPSLICVKDDTIQPGVYVNGNMISNGDLELSNGRAARVGQLSTQVIRNDVGGPIELLVPLKGGNCFDLNNKPITPIFIFDTTDPNNVFINKIKIF